MKKIIIAASLLTACVAFANPYAKCSACHGVNGEKAALGKSLIIQGWPEAKTIEALNGYKAGTLNVHGMGALMKGQVVKLADADIADLAKQIAAMK